MALLKCLVFVEEALFLRNLMKESSISLEPHFRLHHHLNLHWSYTRFLRNLKEVSYPTSHQVSLPLHLLTFASFPCWFSLKYSNLLTSLLVSLSIFARVLEFVTGYTHSYRTSLIWNKEVSWVWSKRPCSKNKSCDFTWI